MPPEQVATSTLCVLGLTSRAPSGVLRFKRRLNSKFVSCIFHKRYWQGCWILVKPENAVRRPAQLHPLFLDLEGNKKRLSFACSLGHLCNTRQANGRCEFSWEQEKSFLNSGGFSLNVGGLD